MSTLLNNTEIQQTLVAGYEEIFAAIEADGDGNKVAVPRKVQENIDKETQKKETEQDSKENEAKRAKVVISESEEIVGVCPPIEASKAPTAGELVKDYFLQRSVRFGYNRNVYLDASSVAKDTHKLYKKGVEKALYDTIAIFQGNDAEGIEKAINKFHPNLGHDMSKDIEVLKGIKFNETEAVYSQQIIDSFNNTFENIAIRNVTKAYKDLDFPNTVPSITNLITKSMVQDVASEISKYVNENVIDESTEESRVADLQKNFGSYFTNIAKKDNVNKVRLDNNKHSQDVINIISYLLSDSKSSDFQDFINNLDHSTEDAKSQLKFAKIYKADSERDNVFSGGVNLASYTWSRELRESFHFVLGSDLFAVGKKNLKDGFSLKSIGQICGAISPGFVFKMKSSPLFSGFNFSSLFGVRSKPMITSINGKDTTRLFRTTAFSLFLGHVSLGLIQFSLSNPVRPMFNRKIGGRSPNELIFGQKQPGKHLEVTVAGPRSTLCRRLATYC